MTAEWIRASLNRLGEIVAASPKFAPRPFANLKAGFRDGALCAASRRRRRPFATLAWGRLRRAGRGPHIAVISSRFASFQRDATPFGVAMKKPEKQPAPTGRILCQRTVFLSEKVEFALQHRLWAIPAPTLTSRASA